MTRQHIVVYGGTFDPFHLGHLAVARYLRDELEPDLVVVAPAGNPRLRRHRPSASANARLRMCELGLKGETGVEVTDVEVRRQGETYTIDTVAELQRLYGSETRIDVAIGADSIASLDDWHRINEMLEMCRLVVVSRPGVNAPEPPTSRLPDDAVILNGLALDVKATDIRRGYGRGDYAATRELVPLAVHRFIVSEELYWCIPN